MVTTFQLITFLKEKELFGALVTSKIISSDYVKYVHVYETYLSCEPTQGFKSSCYEETASRCYLSSERVRKIVALMENEHSITDKGLLLLSLEEV